jgi:alkylation response protein AidB-like acyl-CoA dehydrogenase
MNALSVAGGGTISDLSADALLDGRARELRDRVREIARAEVAPRAAAVDAEARFPTESYHALADAGLAGLLVPERFGGSGDSTLAYAAAMEEITAACGSTSTVYMTQMHCAYPILLAGTDEQREQHLPGLCSGELYGALAVTEPQAGSDVSSLATRAVRKDDGYRLSGAKTFITNGDRAHVAVVFATTDPRRAREAATAFVVERGTPGFESGAVLEKMGQKGSTTAELYFDDAFVPAASRLGDEGSAYALSIRSVTKSRVSAAAQGVGFARAALEGAVRWAHERELLSSGRRDAQDIQFALADLRARTAAARSLLYTSAALIDRGGPDPVNEVSIAKLFCTDTAMAVADGAMALMGVDADRVDLGVEQVWRDAKVTQIYDGTNQVQRLLIARDLRRAAEEGA